MGYRLLVTTLNDIKRNSPFSLGLTGRVKLIPFEVRLALPVPHIIYLLGSDFLRKKLVTSENEVR